MPSHSEDSGIWLSVWRFLFTHCLHERAAEVLARLRGCAGSPEPSLLACAISNKFAWRGPNINETYFDRKWNVLLADESRHQKNTDADDSPLLYHSDSMGDRVIFNIHTIIEMNTDLFKVRHKLRLDRLEPLTGIFLTFHTIYVSVPGFTPILKFGFYFNRLP